jgi:hypothetical protein
MPVPQPGTATAVVSLGTKKGARDGIEGRSVRDGSQRVKPTTGDEMVKRA